MEISGDCRLIVCALGITGDKIPPYVPQQGTMDFGKMLIGQSSPVPINLTESVCEAIVQLYFANRTIFNVIEKDYLADAIYNFFASTTCLLASGTKALKGIAVTRDRDSELLANFIDNVHRYAFKERSVSYYAGLACLSPKYFARVITKVSHHKPGHWIKNYVILEAKTMLATNHYTIQEVSDKLHFPNPSFFCKYFKAETGMSPGKYQNSQK